MIFYIFNTDIRVQYTSKCQFHCCLRDLVYNRLKKVFPGLSGIKSGIPSIRRHRWWVEMVRIVFWPVSLIICLRTPTQGHFEIPVPLNLKYIKNERHFIRKLKISDKFLHFDKNQVSTILCPPSDLNRTFDIQWSGTNKNKNWTHWVA